MIQYTVVYQYNFLSCAQVNVFLVWLYTVFICFHLSSVVYVYFCVFHPFQVLAAYLKPFSHFSHWFPEWYSHQKTRHTSQAFGELHQCIMIVVIPVKVSFVTSSLKKNTFGHRESSLGSQILQIVVFGESVFWNTFRRTSWNCGVAGDVASDIAGSWRIVTVNAASRCLRPPSWSASPWLLESHCSSSALGCLGNVDGSQYSSMI